MNRVFKIKKNRFGLSVVTSELAKNKGKVASVLLSALLSFSSVAIATPVSIQGSATSENAVSIGSNSYATAVDGVATGQGSVATGNGFTREEFNLKVEANKTALDAVNNKQSEVNNASNQLDATNDAISSLTDQINGLSDKQREIADKISQRDNLLEQRDGIQDQINSDQVALDAAKTALDGVSTNNKNLYLNFTDVLNSLDWTKLTQSSDSIVNRNILASELQEKVEKNYPDFQGRYTFSDYQSIINGFVNRQASYQGSYEYLSGYTSDIARSVGDSVLFNHLYFNSSLDNLDYSYDSEKYKFSKSERYLINAVSTDSAAINIGESRPLGDYLVKSRTQGSTWSEGTKYLIRVIDNNSLNANFNNHLKKLNDQSVLNTINLVSLSKQKAVEDNVFTALMKTIDRHNLIVAHNTYVDVDGVNYKDFYNNLIEESVDANKIRFGVKTNRDVNLKMFTTLNNENGLSSPHFYDRNFGILTKIFDFRADNNALITSDDIVFFKSFYFGLKDYYDAIDWSFDKSAINLTDYRASLDNIINYNTKIHNFLELYQAVIDERKKSDADTSKIDRMTQDIISLKGEIIDGMYNKSNFGMGIELTYNKEWAEFYINYAKDDSDQMIARINNELKLYDDTDELIIEATERAKEIQKAYDDAAAQLAKDQSELDNINKQIDELELTESEKSVDDTKRDKEKELKEREADKARLEDDITKGKEELEKLREELTKTELKDLGLRSQAHGSEAFASGDDSIAMGTRATVTANDAIAIGRETLVTGKQSIAIGAESVVTGDKSIAIGVGHIVSGNRSTTIGDPNVVSGNDSFVAGNNNNVASNNVMVMGNSVTIPVGFDGAVVLGDKSTVSAANPTSSITIQNVEYQFAGTSPTSVVSVGAVGNERQISNVAAGRVTESSTDAINGSQLYALVQAVEAVKVNPADLIELKPGENINFDISPDATGKMTYTINAVDTKAEVVAGTSGYILVSNTPTDSGNTYSVDLSDVAKAQLNKDTTVSGGEGIAVTVSSITNANGGITTNYMVSLAQSLVDQIAKEENVVAGSNAITVVQNGQNETGGKTFVVDLSNDAKSQLAKETSVEAGESGNIIVTESGANETGGKTYKVELSNQVNLGDSGSISVGDVVVNADGIDAGNKIISNVAPAQQGTDAVNLNQLLASQTIVKAGDNVSVNSQKNENGSTTYTIHSSKTTASAGSSYVTVVAQDAGSNIVNYVMDLSDETKSAVDNVGKGWNIQTSDGKTTNVQMGDTISVVGDGKNISTVTSTNNGGAAVEVKLADNIELNSVQTVKPAEINPTSREVVQGSQLYQTNQQVNQNTQNIKNLNDKVDRNAKQARRGIAVAAAIGSLPQPTVSGKSMVSAATSHYRGEQALAIGYSRLSDNGKHIFKLNGSSNMSGKKEAVVSAAYGYQW